VTTLEREALIACGGSMEFKMIASVMTWERDDAGADGVAARCGRRMAGGPTMNSRKVP
jgi:hypothetical protein